MAAVSAVMMALTSASSLIVCSEEIYHTGHLLLEELKQSRRIDWKKVDILNIDQVVEACRAVRSPNPNDLPFPNLLFSIYRKLRRCCILKPTQIQTGRYRILAS